MLVLGDRLSRRLNKGKAGINVSAVGSDAMMDFDDEQHVAYSSEKQSSEKQSSETVSLS